jgi:hypothetical protein
MNDRRAAMRTEFGLSVRPPHAKAWGGFVMEEPYLAVRHAKYEAMLKSL